MFSPQTQAALTYNAQTECGCPWPVTLTAEVYRELVAAARKWEAFVSAGQFRVPSTGYEIATESCGSATVKLVEQTDGSIKIEPK